MEVPVTINATRLTRVLGEKPRLSEWHAKERHRAIQPVQRDPRPARAIMGYVMTALALAAVITIGVPIALNLAAVFVRVAQTISSI
jgi:hypothetical protein